MNKAIPSIRESAHELKQLRSHERHPVKQQRLQALYMLASGQARFRSDVARLLGVDRNTVGRWLERYAQGGLDALLALYVPPGKVPALPPDHVVELQQALQQPQGFGSYKKVRQWIQHTFGITLTYNATHKLVRYKLGAKLKVARPSHIKNAEAIAAFRETFADQLHVLLPSESQRPVKLWAMDESRLGLQTVHRRRITARGTKPIGFHQHRFENFYLYGAVAPACGDGYFLDLPKLNADLFQVFLDAFATARPTTLNVLLVDNARCHTAKKLVIPANVVLLFQPPYAPEVNPAERVWQALKDELAWQCFPDLAHL